MTAHRVLQDQFIADHSLIAPSLDTDTVEVDRSPAIVNTGISFFVSDPQAIGLRLAVHNTNSGSGISVKSASSKIGANNATAGASSVSVSNGSMSEFISVELSDGSIIWKKLV